MAKDAITLDDLRTGWDNMMRLRSYSFDTTALVARTLVLVIDELIEHRSRIAELERKVLDDGK